MSHGGRQELVWPWWAVARGFPRDRGARRRAEGLTTGEFGEDLSAAGLCRRRATHRKVRAVLRPREGCAAGAQSWLEGSPDYGPVALTRRAVAGMALRQGGSPGLRVQLSAVALHGSRTVLCLGATPPRAPPSFSHTKREREAVARMPRAGPCYGFFEAQRVAILISPNNGVGFAHFFL